MKRLLCWIGWYKKPVENYIENKGEAIIRLKSIFRNSGLNPACAYAVAIRILDDYETWPIEKKIDFTNEIIKDEIEAKCDGGMDETKAKEQAEKEIRAREQKCRALKLIMV